MPPLEFPVEDEPPLEPSAEGPPASLAEVPPLVPEPPSPRPLPPEPLLPPPEPPEPPPEVPDSPMMICSGVSRKSLRVIEPSPTL